MNKFSVASTILTCLGAIGIVTTSIMAAKATPKAVELLNTAKEEKGDDLTKLETVKVAAPAYIPTVVMGLSTIACIFGANVLTKKSQASITSAYALLNTTYREYTNKVKELYGDEADREIKSEIAKDNYDESIDKDLLSNDEFLFYDFNSHQYFSATISDVLQKTTMDDGLECYIINTPYDIPSSYYYDL